MVDGNQGAPRGVDTDTNDVCRVEIILCFAGLLDGTTDDRYQTVEVILGILPGHIGIRRISQDTELSGRVLPVLKSVVLPALQAYSHSASVGSR